MMGQLISVSERLPECTIECTTSGTEISNTVLLFGKSEMGSNGHGFGHYQDDGKWVCYQGEYEQMHIVEVTHWMRLPRPTDAPAQTAPVNVPDEWLESLMLTVERLNDDADMYDRSGHNSTAADRRARAYEISQMLSAAPSAPIAANSAEWISVEDQLPKKGQHVLMAAYKYNRPENGHFVSNAQYIDGDWIGDDGEALHDATHWMPLPPLPIAATAQGGGDV